MAVSKKTIQRRIKSVRNTRKITKAMELVAAAKMRRAAAAVTRTRPYAKLAWDTVRAIMRQASHVTHPLMQAKPEAVRTLLVLIASDRGLAGGYNVNIMRKAMAFVRERGAKQVDVIAVGRRAEFIAKTGATVVASFQNLANAPQLRDVLPIVRLLRDGFVAGKYADVQIAYTDYVSGITQVPNIAPVLPLVPDAEAVDAAPHTEYLFEPGPAQVLDRILPGIVETKLFHAVLEAVASEHAARMMAMRNATDSASEMLESLTFTYNQARQAAITQEIAELVSGAAALQK